MQDREYKTKLGQNIINIGQNGVCVVPWCIAEGFSVKHIIAKLSPSWQF